MVQSNTKSPLTWSIVSVGLVTLGAVASSYWTQGRLFGSQPFPSDSPPSVTTPGSDSPSGRAADPWAQGLDLGWQAAVAAQTADSPAAWQQVSDLWLQAIAALKQVPADAPQGPQVQAKIQEYLGNLDAAERHKATQRLAQPQASLNLSRQSLQQVFAAPSWGFSFAPAEVVDGRPHLVGRSPDGSTTLDLIGPVQALDQAILTLSWPTAERPLTMAELAAADRVLALAVPDWPERSRWLTTSLNRVQADPQAAMVAPLETLQIVLQADPAQGQMVITVQAKPAS